MTSRIWLVLGALVVTLDATAQPYILDNFESGTNRIVQPNAASQDMRNLWNVYIGSGPTSIISTTAPDGTKVLDGRHVSGTDFQFQFYTYTEALPGWSNGWQYAKEFVNNATMSKPATPWPNGKINRLRFWVKMPPGYNTAIPDHNIEIGTYISTVPGEAETNGGHFYHFLNLRSHGAWELVILDTHPDHSRGETTMVGKIPDDPVGVPGQTYYDTLTRFYFDIPYTAVPGDVLFDDFEFYQETNPENVEQIKSLHGAYLSDGSFEVGWTVMADQHGVNFDVKASCQSIFQGGWASATTAGTATDTGDGGYNSVMWKGSPNLGCSPVYIGVKPQNSSAFRQIAIPTTGKATVSPNAPTGLTAQ